jgi:hypothetical protein
MKGEPMSSETPRTDAVENEPPPVYDREFVAFDRMRTHARQLERENASLTKQLEAIPVELFDGCSVYQNVRQSELHFTEPKHVSAVLDAAVKLIRKNRQAIDQAREGNG